MSTVPHKINQYSMSRSGSTVVWQVLKYLFPDSIVSKRHSPPKPDDSAPTVVTYRDPRSRVASRYRKTRTGVVPLKNKRTLDRLLDDNETHFQTFKQYVDGHKEDPKVLVLCYERYYENFEYLLQQLSTFFHIEVTPEQLQYIQDNFGVEQNLAIASTMHNFHQVNHESQIHGNHISPVYRGEPMSWTKIIDSSLHKYLMKQLKQQLLYFERLK